MVETPPGPEGPREQYIHATEVDVGPLTRSSWGAILAGAVCGLAIYLVLGMIGLAVGIGVIDPAEEADPISGVPFGLGVWWTLSAIAAFFIGGAIAGRLAGFPKDIAGALNGLTVGGLAVLLIAYIATTAVGSAVTGAAGAVAQLFRGDGGQNVNITVRRPPRMMEPGVQPAAGDQQAAAGTQGQQRNVQQQNARSSAMDAQRRYEATQRVQSVVAAMIANEARSLYNDLVSSREERRVADRLQATYADLIKTPGDAEEDVRTLLQFLLSNEGVLGPEDREQAKQVLMQRMGLEDADADKVIDRWQQRYESTVRELQTLVNEASGELGRYVSENANAAASRMEMPDAVRRVVSERQQRRTREIVANTVQRIADSPTSAYGDLQIMIEKLFGQNGVWTEEDLTELRTVLREQMGLTEAEVDRMINRWQQRYQNAAQQVEETWQEVQRTTVEAADATLDQIAEAAGWTAFALFLALAASAVGGMLGRPDDRFAVPDAEWVRHIQDRARALRTPRQNQPD